MKLKESFTAVVHGKNHHWWALAATSSGSFLNTYDLGAVSMSLPHIMDSFQTSITLASWVLLAQVLVSTVLLLPAGRLGDIIGRKKVYNLGFVIFTIGSLLCGLSQNLTELIIFRVFQALGSAMLQTSSFAIVSAVFPERDRGKGLGISSALVSIGTTAGPALGGIIIGLLGWRGIFFVNVPVGIVGTFLAHFILLEERVSIVQKGKSRNFDVVGSCLAAVAIGSLLAGLSLGQVGSWSSAGTISLLVVALIATVAFPVYESRHASPLVDVNLFKNRTFSLNILARFMLFVSVSMNVLLMPFYLQVVLGYSPAETGMLIAPISIAIGAMAPISGWLTNSVSTRYLSAFGMAVLGLGLFLTTRLGVTSGYADVLWRLILIGVGHGIFQTPNNTSIMDSVSRDKFGIASGLMALMRGVGRGIGTSIASIIVAIGLHETVGTVSLYDLKRGGASAIQGPILEAFSVSITNALLVASVLCIPTVIICLLRGKTARDLGELNSR